MQDLSRRSVLAAGTTLAIGGAFSSAGSAHEGCCQQSLPDSNAWTSYRGTAGNNRAVSSAEGFDEPDTIAWQYDERGAFAIADGTVYLRTGSELHALDATDGDVEWTSGDLGAVGGHPAVADDTVYVGGSQLTAVDASSGDVRWSRELDGDCLAPLIAFETVYVLTAGSLYAFDAADGSLRWQRDAVDVARTDGSSTTDTHSFATGQACVAATDGTLWTALDAESPGALAAIDPETGDVRWTAYLDPVDEVTGLAATADRIFVEDLGEETGHVFDIASGSITDSIEETLWMSATETTAVSLGRYSLTGTNVDEGTTWAKDHAYTFGYPTIVGDTVVVAYSEEAPSSGDEPRDELVGFDLADGSERWRFAFDDRQWEGAYRIGCGVAGNTIYVNREEGLTAVRRSADDAADGRHEGNETTGNAGEARAHETTAESGREAGADASDRRATNGNENSERSLGDGPDDNAPGFAAASGVVGGALSLGWLGHRIREILSAT